MRERIVIVFVAVAIGLIVTTLVFFVYQQTKALPNNILRSNTNNNNQQGNESTSVALVVEQPVDESLSDRRTIQVTGTTDVGNTVIVSSNQEDIVAETTNDGEFSVTIDIDTGVNKIITRSIAPNGDTGIDTRIVTYSTDEF